MTKMDPVESYLEKLKSHDVLKYCVTFPQYSRFLRAEKIIRTLDFSMEFNLDISLTDYLMPHIDPSYVTVFNVNGLYWIPAEELRSCIKQFHNLECLCVLGTAIHVSDEDGLCLSSLHKLKKIAINMHKFYITNETIKRFPRIKSLMLYLIGNEMYSRATDLASDPRTEDLWIISRSKTLDSMSDLVLKMGLKRFVHHHVRKNINRHESAFSNVGDLNNLGSAFCDMNSDCGIHIDRTYDDRALDITVHDTYLNKSLGIWSSPDNICSCGVEDIRMLLRGCTSYFVKELNFNHFYSDYCTRSLYDTAACLKSPLVKNLQKLSFKCCSPENVFTGHNRRTIWKMKPKIEALLLLNQVGINFPHLKELAIFKHCWDVPVNLNLNYGTISNLKYLQKLTLCVLETTPSQFITEVLQKCTELQVLKIDCIGNAPFMDALFSAMKFTMKLKDFRCEVTSTRLNMDSLFGGLIEKEDCKLERLAVMAHESSITDIARIPVFLDRNPQLVFVGLFIKDIPEMLLTLIKNDLDYFKMANNSTSDRKSFTAAKSYLEVSELQPIPQVHLHEMLYSVANKSICDLCNDFMLSDYLIC